MTEKQKRRKLAQVRRAAKEVWGEGVDVALCMDADDNHILWDAVEIHHKREGWYECFVLDDLWHKGPVRLRAMMEEVKAGRDAKAEAKPSRGYRTTITWIEHEKGPLTRFWRWVKRLIFRGK